MKYEMPEFRDHLTSYILLHIPGLSDLPGKNKVYFKHVDSFDFVPVFRKLRRSSRFASGRLFLFIAVTQRRLCNTFWQITADQTETKRRPNPDQTQAKPLFRLCFIYIMYMFILYLSAKSLYCVTIKSPLNY